MTAAALASAFAVPLRVDQQSVLGGSHAVVRIGHRPECDGRRHPGKSEQPGAECAVWRVELRVAVGWGRSVCQRHQGKGRVRASHSSRIS
jgi:hypothetical protein